MSDRSEAIALLRAPATTRQTWRDVVLRLLGMRFLPAAWRCATESGESDAFLASGRCLRPWILDGDAIVWIQGMSAQDGDLVITETRFPIRAGLGTPSRIVRLMGCKQLRISADGARWLTCADGAYLAAGEHTVIGTVIAVLRRPGLPWKPRASLRAMAFALPADPLAG
jgi:hypothetical protein